MTKQCDKCHGTGKIPDDQKLGKQLRALRERQKISVREMARRLGVSAPFVSDMELGRRHWKEWAKRFKEALGK